MSGQEPFLARFAVGEHCDRLPAGRGRFGLDKTNPIPGDAYGYIRGLRCPAGHRLDYEVRGNTGCGPDGHYVDRFELFCLGGEFAIDLNFDCYHPGISALVPDGVLLATP